jgi:hypothetical protein
MPEYRSILDIKNNTNPVINSMIDSLTLVNEVMPLVMANSVLTDRISIKGERELGGTSAVVADCESTLTSVAMSGQGYAYDLEAIVRPFSVCEIAEADGLAAEVQKNLFVALRDMGETISQLAIGDIESQTANVDSAGAATFTLDDLDTLFYEVKNKTAGSFIYFGGPSAIKEIIASIRAELGGVNYTEMAGLQVPVYRGVPILTTEHATDKTITAVDFGSFQGYFNKLGTGVEVAPFLTLTDLGPAVNALKHNWRVGTLFTSVILSGRNVARLFHA